MKTYSRPSSTTTTSSSRTLTLAQPQPNLCVLSSPYVRVPFTFKDLTLNSFNNSLPITLTRRVLPLLRQLRPWRPGLHVRPHRDEQLPPRRLPRLPLRRPVAGPLYLLLLLLFLFDCAFLGIWIYFCLFKNRLSSHQMHYLMAGLLLTKAINLLFAAEDQHYIRSMGTPHGWDVLFYIFQFLKGVLLFTVVVLIGTGWSFLNPFLQEKEKKVLMIVIPLQVIANIASVVIGETGPFIQDWITWNQVFIFIDIVCCCVILFPIVWWIRVLKETSKTDGKAARNLAKLTLFRQFYIVVIGYLYFTRIVAYALRTIATCKYRWVSVVAVEAASLAFYVFMFYMFRPVERNEYFVLEEEEEEVAMVALREEEFEL